MTNAAVCRSDAGGPRRACTFEGHPMGEKKKHMRHDDRGATSIEYALIATMVAIVIIGSLTTLGTTLSTRFVSVNSGFTGR